MKNNYHIGQFVEMMDNSFNAEKTDKNIEIITTQNIQLSKLMFSDYYKVEPGEEKAMFKINESISDDTSNDEIVNFLSFLLKEF